MKRFSKNIFILVIALNLMLYLLPNVAFAKAGATRIYYNPRTVNDDRGEMTYPKNFLNPIRSMNDVKFDSNRGFYTDATIIIPRVGDTVYSVRDTDVFEFKILDDIDSKFYLVRLRMIRECSYYEINNPEIIIKEPLSNKRIGNQDNLLISGSVKDADAGDIIKVKYNLANIKNREITLTQPKNIIANGQNQSFQGYINLNGLTTGESILELFAEDNKGGISSKVNVSINVFNSLESILKSLKSYTYKSGQAQFMVVNTDTIIVQDTSNDNLINQIRQELRAKNIKLYFIGKDGPTRAYLESKLLR